MEATRALTAHGAAVIGGVRDLAKAEANLTEAGVDLDRVTLHRLDLASLDSVRAFTDEVLATNPTLDVIMANAGIMACPQGTTQDGFELQFGTNHLGHFVLVNRLLPALRDGGRIVILSSSGHRFSDVDLDDPNFEDTPYDAWVAYGRAKTANVLFAVELDRRLRGRGVRATALHPGGIMTELARHLTDETLGQLIEARKGHDTKFKSVPEGAATQVLGGGRRRRRRGRRKVLRGLRGRRGHRLGRARRRARLRARPGHRQGPVGALRRTGRRTIQLRTGTNRIVASGFSPQRRFRRFRLLGGCRPGWPRHAPGRRPRHARPSSDHGR